MPEVLLFTKPGCQKCEWIKERIPPGLSINVLNMETADGLAEAAYYELLNRNAPILVVDEVVTEGAINIVDRLKNLAGVGDI
jgi:deoxyxylulose-5-phosphate synthase